MKRIFVFAVLAGAFAVPASMAHAQMGDAPQNDAEVIQPAQRGALGGLASGAPSVAQTVQPGAAAPQAAAPQAVAPQGAAPQAGIAQAPAGQGAIAQQGVGGQAVAGQGVVAQQGIAQQGVAGQAVGGQAIAGQAVAGQAGVAQTGIVSQGVVAQGNTVVGMQQSMMARMQRHFLVQQAFQHCMFFSEFQPHVIRPQAMHLGFGPGPFFGPVAGDLELMSIGMVADGIADRGPMYRVTFKNNSPIAARHFRVSLIATLGQLQQNSPVVSVNIDEVAAGGIANVDIQLPAGVMSLGTQPGPFSQLIAVIDSFGELFETDKLNNVLTLTRTDIAIITTTTVAPAAAIAPAAAAVAAPVGAAPAAAAPVGPAVAAPVAPQAAPAPQRNGELDKIDLDQVSGASDLLDR